eukprot:CAMPEP_0182531412 /NCGR_PEP_ID=MMETSP1323-20130603/8835_1 /TAXON_ID=236787 /ORGANISM="Florenciella parvula, Strain RCC1693" /LENGTH=453 /DNA_ID=CAMNT_0024740961 /DNA_START=42 /DNA_END=1399 /DNA_ORIENTATION=+
MASTISPGSRCTTRVKATHSFLEWEIDGYSGLPGAEQQATRSPVMEAAGHRWQMSLYPGGTGSSTHRPRSRRHVALFLNYCGEEELRVKFHWTLVNQAAGKQHLVKEATTVMFGKCTDGVNMRQGDECFVESDQMADESNGWWTNDRVVIRLDLTVFGDPASTVSVDEGSWEPPKTWQRDMNQVLDELPWFDHPAETPTSTEVGAEAAKMGGLATDCVINVTTGSVGGLANGKDVMSRGRSFAVHRLVLCARSPYLRGLFSSPMLEAQSGVVNETEIEPDVFEQMLCWVYTDTLGEGVVEVMGEHLLMASNKYGCDGLKLVCELALCETLTVENVAARLVLGEQAEADQLKEDALDYIAPRAAKVMASKGWQDVIAYGGATLVSEVLALLAGAPSVGSGGGGGGQDFSPSQDGPTPVPVRKRSADEAGLAPHTSQRRLSLSNGGANAVGAGAG